MFTSSISKPSVSTGVALTSLSVAAIATLGILTAPAAQAAIISGQVSGTWDYTFAGFNVGDAFTADYTYDSDSITINDYSDGYYYDRYLASSAPLLSLVLNSGAITYVFNLDNVYVSGAISWFDVKYNPDDYVGDYEFKQTYIDASGYSDPSYNLYEAFLGYTTTSQSYGTPYSDSYASAYQYDSASGNYPFYGSANSGVSISDTTAVPTPALLPGLIGMGVGVLRRRKQTKAETVAA